MASRKFRTAVLVVHGMGSQRPLDTVGGIVNAVRFDDDDHAKGDKRVWSHPQPSGVDIDLTVMTTNAIPGTADERSADFHELYWAHHMSETKAVAVLLWLFELGRRGPYFQSRVLNGLWWCGAVSTDCANTTDGFKHTSYWKTACEPDRRNGPHLAALRAAVNLEDK